jgi:N-acetylglucosamine kinase-like BadF-type ATPase
MILIADSGSTKTDWCLLHADGQRMYFAGEGINPYFQHQQDVARIARDTFQHHLPGSPERIYFYGAGCSSPEKQMLVKQGLLEVFSDTRVQVDHDMLAAARALCHNSAGIACILGTGSNSVLFNGSEINEDVPSLGFILGDEGSGAYLGKELIRRFLYRELPEWLHESFVREFKLNRDTILEQVYKKPLPNRYLASFSPFIHAHLNVPEMHDLVYRAFEAFIKHHISKYTNYHHTPMHCTGSVAYHFKSILEEVCSDYHIQLGHVVKSPLEGLTTYHEQQWKKENNL